MALSSLAIVCLASVESLLEKIAHPSFHLTQFGAILIGFCKLRKFKETDAQILEKPLFRLQITDSAGGERIRIVEKLEVQYVQHVDRHQLLVALPVFEIVEVALRPVAKRATLHVLLIDELNLDLGFGTRVKLAGKVKARCFGVEVLG